MIPRLKEALTALDATAVWSPALWRLEGQATQAAHWVAKAGVIRIHASKAARKHQYFDGLYHPLRMNLGMVDTFFLVLCI